MKGNLPIILNNFVYDDEGDDFEVRATEGGGAVKLGVTFENLQEYWKTNKLGVPTFDDLKAITRVTAVPIYDQGFWQPARCDELKSGVDYVFFDPEMNSGRTGGIRILETALGVLTDGTLTDAVIAAANSLPPDIVIDNVCDARIIHMRLNADWNLYQKGWVARVERVRTRAKGMLTT